MKNKFRFSHAFGIFRENVPVVFNKVSAPKLLLIIYHSFETKQSNKICVAADASPSYVFAHAN